MRKGKQKSGGGGGGRLFPNSIRIIGSCLRNVSANASTVASTVRSASATVAASISASSGDHKDQVTWAGFDKLELDSSTSRRVLLLGYRNGFNIFDVEDASSFSELVSKRDIGPVTFLQMQPIPLKSNSEEGFKRSHPLLLVVAEDETNNISSSYSGTVGGESSTMNAVNYPTVVRFYSLRSHCYIHDLRFRSPVCMVRCSPRIVAVGLATQIQCYDALTLENKFSVLTYPVPQLGGQGRVCVNVGYGPMALGHRWLAYASNNTPLLNTGWLSPKSVSPSKVTSPSTSPSSSTLVARYAMESGRHLAAGIVNLGDKGYKTISKYYQEIHPDGSNSATFASTGSISSKPASTEADSVGVVVVKDCVSKAVIAQFRAHSSPISALCFDPSGTLLVTASVHGNTINIFRIMPSNNFGACSQSHDSCSSYLHLYKLHRGIRAAVIQDICFSHYSQWVAIVSSKGTCHVFVLSPFGGEVGFKVYNSQGEEPSLSPVLTSPWWSTSTFSMNNLSSPPPPPVSPVVVSRIRDNRSGLLNTVSNAAASVSGKSSIPSGALVAIFHNSMHGRHQQGLVGLKSLEHLLVFTPSGFVVQHEILPSLGSEQSTGGSGTQSFASAQVQDAELSVCIQPLQWWDACRRSDLPEREECVSKIPFRRPEVAGFILRDSNQSINNKETLETKSDETRSYSSHERTHGYLSNAEVQYNTGRLSVWQNAKISFCMMGASRLNDFASGEFEIEKVPLSQVEIRQKDLLPVFDHFHSVKSAWNERGSSRGRSVGAFPSESRYQKDRPTEETIISHSKPASLSSTESSDGGSSRRMDNLIDMDHVNTEKPCNSFSQTPKDLYHDKQDSILDELSFLGEKFAATTVSTSTQQTRSHSLVEAFFVQNELPSKTRTPSLGRTTSVGAPALNIDVTYKLPSLVTEDADASKINSDKAEPLPLHDSLGVLPTEDLCDEKLEMIGGEKPKEDVEVPDNLCCERNLIHEEEKEQEEDDMLGSVFDFSEEA